MSNSKKLNDGEIVSDNYIIIQKIGSGSFGEVYIAEYKNGGYVAAKIEDRTKSPRIINEYNIYKYLQRKNFTKGLPTIYDFVQTEEFNMLFMQLLGPSLEDLFVKYNRKFNLPTVYNLAIQFIELMRQLHTTNFIHRDIKPNNFLIGRDLNKTQIYIMDFGLSKKYMTGGKHIAFRDGRSLIGTARYASRNMHMGIEPSRRDDLESIGYMLIYFIKGSLPWQGLRKEKNTSHLEIIGNCKMCTTIDSLCKGVPNCFREYLEYIRGLKFDDDPDYKYMKDLFINEYTRQGIIPKFIWEDDK
jgi:serine/threonine protein kinase